MSQLINQATAWINYGRIQIGLLCIVDLSRVFDLANLYSVMMIKRQSKNWRQRWSGQSAIINVVFCFFVYVMAPGFLKIYEHVSDKMSLFVKRDNPDRKKDRDKIRRKMDHNLTQWLENERPSAVSGFTLRSQRPSMGGERRKRTPSMRNAFCLRVLGQKLRSRVSVPQDKWPAKHQTKAEIGRKRIRNVVGKRSGEKGW